MFNRLGTKAYGPSGNLEEVARAPMQFAQPRAVTAKEAELIRSRIRAIASGSLPDITKGGNEFRTFGYTGPWMQRHPEGNDIGGNVFANNPKSGQSPYAAFTGGGNLPDLSDSKDWVAHLKEMRDKQLITNDQCVSLATASVGIPAGSAQEGGHVADWRRGEFVMGGHMVAGTPISTFMDDSFRQSNLYAGGQSVGRPGWNKDHAGEFESYIRDKNGQIIGMNVLWQAAHNKPHLGQYYLGGKGEQNMANYFGVDVASGGHLGGVNNPLNAMRRYAQPHRPVTPLSGPPGHSPGAGGVPVAHAGDMSKFQGANKQYAIRIDNQAGANYAVQGGMLGNTSGGYGMT